MCQYVSVKDFNRNKIIFFSESSEKTKLFYKNADPSLLIILDEADKLLNFANEPFRVRNNWLKDLTIHYNRFVPAIEIIKKLIADKTGLENTFVYLQNEKDKLYKLYCKEDSFWKDIINDKDNFDKLPHVIGTLIEDNFLIFDGHHRATTYCLNNNLSLGFDIL